jgi:hypothetical protein
MSKKLPSLPRLATNDDKRKPNELAGENPFAMFAMCFRKVNKKLNIKKLFRNLMANMATLSWGAALNRNSLPARPPN